MGLTDTELDRITAGTMTIGDANSGGFIFIGATSIDVTDSPNISVLNLVSEGELRAIRPPE